MNRATFQLNSALHYADATFNAIAEALIFLEPILFFVSDTLRCAFSGLRDGDLCDAQAVGQAFIVWREETAIARQHFGDMAEAFAMLFEERRQLELPRFYGSSAIFVLNHGG